MEVITSAVDAVQQLVHSSGVVLVPIVSVSFRTSKGIPKQELMYPGNTLMSEGLAVIFINLPPPSETLLPSPSYKSIPATEKPFSAKKQQCRERHRLVPRNACHPTCCVCQCTNNCGKGVTAI